MKKILYTIMVLAMLTACGQGRDAASDNGQDISMKYSDLLTLTQGEGYVQAEIRNPWDTTKVLHSYILVPKDKKVPAHLPEGDVVRTPLSHAVYYTSVHVSLANQLGAYNSIAGVCDKEYMYLKQLKNDIASGKIADCGKGINPNIEKIMDLQPDAILLSPFENSGSYGKLGTLGIPIIECADYMETSALGRAEWMRFYGILNGHQATADSLFAQVESRYDSLQALVSNVKKKPTVLADMKFGSSWYIAGANSTAGRLYADAGADYVFKDEKSSGSVPYAPEIVFDRGVNAQIWLIKYNQETDYTYAQIAKEWSNYGQLAAFKNHNVYACNLLKVPFYEETPFHPDMLLKDYIIIFHPEVIKDHNMRYFHKVEK